MTVLLLRVIGKLEMIFFLKTEKYHLIGIYLFLVQSVITAPFRQISKEYLASTGNVNYQNNQIMFLISILIASIVALIVGAILEARYRN